MDKITIELNEKFNAVAPEDRNCCITAALSSGREVKAEKCHTRQYSERPIPKHLVEEKFRKITANTLSTKSQDELIDIVWHLDEQEQIDQLVTLTGV